MKAMGIDIGTTTISGVTSEGMTCGVLRGMVKELYDMYQLMY